MRLIFVIPLFAVALFLTYLGGPVALHVSAAEIRRGK